MRSALVCLAFALAACTNSVGSPPVEEALAPASLIGQLAAATPEEATPEATPLVTSQAAPPIIPLVVWLPEPIAPIANADADAERAMWLNGFAAAEPNIALTLRIKKASDVGGVMASLRSASLVAPAAVPDLTLMRRADLVAAWADGLIYPIPPSAFVALADDFHLAVAALGEVEQERVGLPFTVDLLHMATRAGAVTAPAAPETWRFDAVLERGATIYAPFGRATPLNDMFFAQYRAMSPGATEAVDGSALERLLAFYERGTQAGIFPEGSGAFASPADYLPLLAGQDAGVLTSSMYLAIAREGATLDFAPLPTEAGVATTSIDGWVWVLTSADAQRQAAALAWLNWVFDVDRHARYASAIAMLPTGRTTLRQHSQSGYANFADALLANAQIALNEASGGAPARAIQGALLAVLTGETAAEQATRDVLAATSG